MRDSSTLTHKNRAPAKRSFFAIQIWGKKWSIACESRNVSTNPRILFFGLVLICLHLRRSHQNKTILSTRRDIEWVNMSAGKWVALIRCAMWSTFRTNPLTGEVSITTKVWDELIPATSKTTWLRPFVEEGISRKLSIARGTELNIVWLFMSPNSANSTFSVAKVQGPEIILGAISFDRRAPLTSTTTFEHH